MNVDPEWQKLQANKELWTVMLDLFHKFNITHSLSIANGKMAELVHCATSIGMAPLEVWSDRYHTYLFVQDKID